MNPIHEPIFSITVLDHCSAAIAAQMLAIQLAAYRVESELIDYPNLPPLFEEVADLQMSSECFLGCWLGEQLVGVISFDCQHKVVEICRLVVDPTFARRGIGRQLLRAVEEYAVGWRVITVSTAERNLPALNLYEKHGYRIQQRRQLTDGLRLVGLEKVRT